MSGGLRLHYHQAPVPFELIDYGLVIFLLIVGLQGSKVEETHPHCQSFFALGL